MPEPPAAPGPATPPTSPRTATQPGAIPLAATASPPPAAPVPAAPTLAAPSLTAPSLTAPSLTAPCPSAPAPAAPDPWHGLRALTPARIGLPRAGAALATRPLLELRLAHARARDAVAAALDAPALLAALSTPGQPALLLHSRAPDHAAYLRRPDLGRDLDDAAPATLSPHATGWDLAVVVADGLSARAAERQAPPLLARLLPALQAAGWRIAPRVVLRHGRVAAGDAVATLLRATAACVLIGERPGLSTPDSLGAYLTWAPGPATTDADRNCVSNIQPHGLSPGTAAHRIAHLLSAMRTARRSGVQLKDTSVDPAALPGP